MSTIPGISLHRGVVPLLLLQFPGTVVLRDRRILRTRAERRTEGTAAAAGIYAFASAPLRSTILTVFYLVSLHILNNKIPFFVADLLELYRYLAQQIEDETAEGIEIVEGQFDTGLLLQILKVDPGIAEEYTVTDLQNILNLVVELV